MKRRENERGLTVPSRGPPRTPPATVSTWRRRHAWPADAPHPQPQPTPVLRACRSWRRQGFDRPDREHAARLKTGPGLIPSGLRPSGAGGRDEQRRSLCSAARASALSAVRERDARPASPARDRSHHMPFSPWLSASPTMPASSDRVMSTVSMGSRRRRRSAGAASPLGRRRLRVAMTRMLRSSYQISEGTSRTVHRDHVEDPIRIRRRLVRSSQAAATEASTRRTSPEGQRRPASRQARISSGVVAATAARAARTSAMAPLDVVPSCTRHQTCDGMVATSDHDLLAASTRASNSDRRVFASPTFTTMPHARLPYPPRSPSAYP